MRCHCLSPPGVPGRGTCETGTIQIQKILDEQEEHTIQCEMMRWMVEELVGLVVPMGAKSSS